MNMTMNMKMNTKKTKKIKINSRRLIRSIRYPFWRRCTSRPPKDSGGYNHWRCEDIKGHKDWHIFRMYEWDDSGSVRYGAGKLPSHAGRVKYGQPPLAKWMMETFGRDWCGNNSPPRNSEPGLWLGHKEDDESPAIFTFVDDGATVGIGSPDHWWCTHISWEMWRRAMWWMMRVWVKDWFGLRTKLYYIGLHGYVTSELKWTPHKKQKIVKIDKDKWYDQAAERKLMRKRMEWDSLPDEEKVLRVLAGERRP